MHYVQRLLAHFDADPLRTALVSEEVALTAGQLAGATRRAASVMSEQGMGRGGVVGILTAPNTAATLILQWAANLTGAAAVHLRWVHPDGQGDELRVELRRFLGADAGARMLAVDPANEQRLRDLLPDAAGGPVLGVLGPGQPGSVDLTTGSAGGVPPCPELSGDDLAVVTQIRLPDGVRAGVCWTFGVRNSMLAAAPCLPTRAAARAGGPARLLLITPIIHFDVFAAEDTLVSGGLVVLQPGFVAGSVLRAVADHRITRLMLGGPHVSALAEHPDRAATDLSSLTDIVCGGSPGPPHRRREVREIFGPRLRQIYGTTEAGVLAELTPDDHGDPDAATTAGRPVDPAALSIRDPRTGAPLDGGETGEIYAAPSWPPAGYWHEPELTAALIRDGWVRTGDVGYLDDGGRLHVIGRLADMMTIEGVSIHAEVVEKVLAQAPGVSLAAVCGIEDADGAEHIYAAVVPEPGAVVDPGELRRHVAAALSDIHVPSLIDIRAKLPRTGWGKPDRVRLRSDAGAALARLVRH
ncbi:class I adenylate-forming enzyme family protein [Actinoplanes sp. NPDC000266]